MENCKGCYTYTNIYNDCSPRLMAKSDKCPCRMCLVKVVCGIACEEYSNFAGILVHETCGPTMARYIKGGIYGKK